MPLYTFEHIATGRIEEAFFHMDDTKVYSGPNGDQPGQWRRYWGVPPSAAVDTVIDPHSEKDFVKVTAKHKGTMGELWDRSAELSQIRASKEGGVDPVKQSYYDQFTRKRGGKKHPQQAREEAARRLRERGINVEGDW